MLCSEEIAVSVTAAAITISKNLPPDKVSLLAAVFTQLGDTLVTLSEANALIDSCGGKEHRCEFQNTT